MICSSWALSIVFSLIGIGCQEKNSCDFNTYYIFIFVYMMIPAIFLTIIILCVRICCAFKNRQFQHKLQLDATTLLLISIAVACVLWIPGIILYSLYHEDQGNHGKLYGYLFLYYAHPIINACLYGYAIKKGNGFPLKKQKKCFYEMPLAASHRSHKV